MERHASAGGGCSSVGGGITLPRPSELSPSVWRFLEDNFCSQSDLVKSTSLESGLIASCSDLEATISNIVRKISEFVADHAIHSNECGALLRGVKEGLVDLRSVLATAPLQDGGCSFLEELPALAREVARVETVRAYAEMALKLDSMIGDVEDAVSSSVTGKLRDHAANMEGSRKMAISSLKDIEGILNYVRKERPRWACLVSVVDNRVDKALAVLRPQAIADHRSLLASLGWPPPLAGSNLTETETTKKSELKNPLFSMKGDLKSKYSESFLSLCRLQEFQRCRKSRQLEGYNLENLVREPLWVIDELVNPLSLAAERHFAKWTDKPEFTFALVYKIIRDFVDSMDDILQPLVDKANLVGYSCREEWISGMVSALLTYLSKEIFPKSINLLHKIDNNDGLHGRTSMLNLVDLLISFDKRIQLLVTNSGLLLKEDENLPRVWALSLFCDRPDWLDIWAEVEKEEILDKLILSLQDEKLWCTRVQGSNFAAELDDFKSPAISGVLVQNLFLLLERARPLPSIALRARFIKLTLTPLALEFLSHMLQRCQEADGLTALADDDAVLKVSWAVNAARYMESLFMEWCEDVFFLEMEDFVLEKGGDCFFWEEINQLKEFRAEWIEKMATVILRGFNVRSRDYLKNRRQWQEKSEESPVSMVFVDLMDYIQGKISSQEKWLNAIDFVSLWRLVADGIDQLLFTGILMGGIKFNENGFKRLNNDLKILFGVFSAWCMRPEGFFPKLHEGMRILGMEESELHRMLKGNDALLHQKDRRALSVAEVEKIIKTWSRRIDET